MNTSKEVSELVRIADNEEFVSRLAKECIIKIDSAGGLGCTISGQKLVAEKILEIIKTSSTIHVNLERCPLQDGGCGSPNKAIRWCNRDSGFHWDEYGNSAHAVEPECKLCNHKFHNTGENNGND